MSTRYELSSRAFSAGDPLLKLIVIALAEMSDQDGIVVLDIPSLSDFTEIPVVDLVPRLEHLVVHGVMRDSRMRSRAMSDDDTRDCYTLVFGE